MPFAARETGTLRCQAGDRGFVPLLGAAEPNIDLNSFDPRESMVDVFLQGVGWRRLPTREPKRISAADKAWPYPFAIELTPRG
jgi:hypothetical protein